MNVILGSGCPKCGAADHTVSVDVYYPPENQGGGETLDIVLACTECGHSRNAFVNTTADMHAI